MFSHFNTFTVNPGPFSCNQVITPTNPCEQSLSPYATPKAIMAYPPFMKGANQEMLQLYYKERLRRHDGYMRSKM